MTGIALLLAGIAIGTWNGNWFPSGRAEHRAAAEVEESRSRAAAAMLAEGLRKVDPEGTNDVILCLNEMRGSRAVSNLVAAIGRPGLRLVSISGYRRRDRFDTQQDAIATTLPAAECGWSRWRNARELTPPRGYAFAALVIDPATTARVYAVHLKSDYGATTEAERQQNRAKRANSIVQLIEIERPTSRRKTPPVVIAGDFNADRWGADSGTYAVFGPLEKAGFGNPLRTLDEKERWTHFGKGKWPNSALDYVMTRGVTPVGDPATAACREVSDHRALFVLVERRVGK